MIGSTYLSWQLSRARGKWFTMTLSTHICEPNWRYVTISMRLHGRLRAERSPCQTRLAHLEPTEILIPSDKLSRQTQKLVNSFAGVSR